MAVESETRIGSRATLRRLVIVAFGTVLLLVIGFGSPASAHDSAQWLGNASYGGVTSAHDYAYACDTMNDNHPIYTEYHYGGTVRWITDPNGPASGCGWAHPGPGIGAYRVCINLSYYPDNCT